MKKIILRSTFQACLISLLFFGGLASAETQRTSKPNIIFIMADDTDNMLLAGFSEPTANDSTTVVDDIAIWRQPLMPMQVAALYQLGNRFAYNASEVDSLFNTPEEDGVTRIGNHLWQRVPLEDTTDVNRLIVRELPNAIEVRFGEVMVIRSEHL